MNNDELYNSHEVIKETCDDDLWQALESAISVLSPKELSALNYRMNLGVADGSDWREYVNTLRAYEWYRFNDGYHYATGSYYGA